MIDLTGEEVDNLMSEIGIKLANEAVGKSRDDDDIDDILVKKLGGANEDQRYEIVDNMLDVLAVSELLRQALSDDNKLDADEIEELVEYLSEIEEDTKEVMKDLVSSS